MTNASATALGLPEASRPSRVAGTDGATHTWQLASESPIEIDIVGTPVAVLLATPRDIAELALGFAWSEGLLTRVPLAPSVAIASTADGIVANLQVAPDDIATSRLQERRFPASSGCGLCGLADLAALRRRTPNTTAHPSSLTDVALANAFAALPSQQPLNHATHSVHAAAWCALDGGILDVREDIGRHNALDKLLGARLLTGAVGEPGFVLMTSRLSFELVYKAHALGAVALAAISAPTTLALDLAERLGIALYCLAAPTASNDAAGARVARRRVVRCLP